MKSLSIGLVAVVCLAPSAVVARDAAIGVTIQRMMDGFNTGDIAAVKALHVASPTIVDNVAPFAWSGPDAFDRWLADLGKAETAEGKSGGRVTFAPIVDEIVRGERAYVVARSAYAYTQRGHKMRETGFTAFVLVKSGAGWKVESWAWASPTAVRVK